MQRVSSGYTVLEVMIVLSVSTMLIASAWNLIYGRQEKTSFDQKVRETQSMLQQWISDVSTGITNGDPSTQWCDANTGSPQVVKQPTKSSLLTYTPVCTFLGKAIQFTHGSSSPSQASTLYVYSVFGCRYTGCTTTILPPDMKSANPEPALGGSGGGNTYADLTETFDLGPAYVKSVCGVAQGGGSIPANVTLCSVGPNASSHMIGFMNSFNTDNNTSANGSEDIKAYLYDLIGNYPAPAYPTGPDPVRYCLELNSASVNCNYSNDPPGLLGYQFCLTDGKNNAQITITSASGTGVSTHLDYIASC